MGFDVTMRHADALQVEQSFEHLVGIELLLEGRDGFGCTSVLGDEFTHVEWEEVHDHVEVLLFALPGEKGVFHSYDIRVIEYL